MNRRKLVDALYDLVVDGVVSDEVSIARQPPGRRPSVELVARAEWFNGLDDADQSQVVDMLRSTAYGALHTVLVLLDGAAALDDAGSAGRLQLLWRGVEDLVDFTESAGEPDLHDLLAETRGR
jgi:hypothetical protein